MNARHMIVALPLVVGLAYASGTMNQAMVIPTKPETKCYTEVALPDRNGTRARLWMDCDLSSQIIPPAGNTVGKSPWQRPRVHPVKVYYDRVPEQETRTAATPAAGKIDRGCKPGRTRNKWGICGRWR